ncbi:MAG: hypothetical protein MUF71_01655 [Candidatus Kapabacteria bacterium]|nr:hypothetical protein [Candidatus Kapabacteria bacterium]
MLVLMTVILLAGLGKTLSQTQQSVRYIAPEIQCEHVGTARTQPSLLPMRQFDLIATGLRVDSLALRVADTSVQRLYLPPYAFSLVSAAIDYNSAYTQLRVFRNSKVDKRSIWIPNMSAFFLAHAALDSLNGNIALHFTAKGLPLTEDTNTREIRGTVAVRCSVIAVAPQTQDTIKATSLCIIPIQARYKPQRGKMPYWCISQASVLCKDCSEEEAKHISWIVKSAPLRKELYDWFCYRGRINPRVQGLSSLPLVVNATSKCNGTFHINTIRLGNAVATRSDLFYRIPQTLHQAISEPLSRSHKPLYAFQVLSAQQQTEERKAAQSLALEQSLYEGEEVIRNIDNYSHAGYALYLADSALTRFLSDIITPTYPRNSALESAEKNCPESNEIIRRASQRLAIPDVVAFKSGNVSDCERVRKYYSEYAEVIRIGQVYVVVNHQDTIPKIVGLAGICAPSGNQLRDEDFLKNSLNVPISLSVFDAYRLVQFPIKTLAIPTNAANAAHRIKTRNLYEYCLEALKHGLFTDCTASVMPFPATGIGTHSSR